MAIGRPISLTPNIATKNISSIATADQTEFTVTGGYRINEIAVYRNGVRLAEGRDFTASDGDTVNLVTAATVDDVIEFAVFDSFNVSDAIVSAASSQNLNGDFNVTGNLYAGSFKPSQFVAGIVTSSTAFHVGSALTANAAGDVETIGIITASSFSGTFSGAASQVTVTDNESSNETNLITFVADGGTSTGSHSLEMDGNLNYNPNTGRLSATELSGSNHVDGGTGTFSGAVNIDATTDSTSSTSGALIVDGGLGVAKNVYIGAGLSVAGTLTYEDVTSVDSVGMVTAKSGVNVSGGQLQVGVAYSVGSAGVATAAGFVGGTISGTTGTFTGDINLSGTASGVSSVTWDASANSLIFNDNSKAVFGTGSDGVSIYHDGSQSRILENGTGGLRIGSDTGIELNKGTSENMLVCTPDAEVKAFYNNSKKWETTNDGTVTTGIGTFTGNIISVNVEPTGNINMPDSGSGSAGRLRFGAGADLQLYHDGSHNYISGSTAGQDLKISNNGNFIVQTSDGDDVIRGIKDGAVDLWFNDSKKFETTNDGVVISGICTDSLGNVRDIPLRSVTGSAATLVVTDAGKVVSTNTTGWTVPASTFSEGDTVTLLNNSAGNLTITCSAVTTYLTSDGSTVTSSTLGARGLATLYFVSSSVAYLQGTSLS